MCDPLTMVAVAGPVANIAQQQAAASAQRKYDRFIQREGTKSAHAAAIEEFKALQTRENEERAAHAQAVSEVTRQAREAQAATSVMLGESGQTGRTAEQLLNQFEQREAQAIQSSRQGLESVSGQLRREAFAVRARERERILSLIPPPRLGPLDSPIGIVASGLGIAGAGLQAFQSTQPVR